MKKLISTCAFLMLVSSVFAITFTVGDITYSTTSGNNVEVTSKSPLYTGSVSIPSTVIYSAVTYNVTSIGYRAFNNCTGLTSITIPSSVTSLGDDALYNCTGLTSITIPNSVTSLGANAFAFCSGLSSVTIPSFVTSIGSYVFFNCSGLISVDIQASVTSIGNSPFMYCSKLTSVTIPSSVTSIEGAAFYNCSSLTSITIPSLVTSIGESAFKGCSKLASITIPSSVISIGDMAFYGCSALTAIDVDGANANFSSAAGVLFNKNKTTLVSYPGGKVAEYVIPSDVTLIGSNAFSNCNVTSVTIPNSVISIGDGAFQDCWGLISITIPSSVTSIGSAAFMGCTNLSSITIPNSVTSIGFLAFDASAWYDNQPDGVVYAATIAYKYKGSMPANTSITLIAGTTAINSEAFYMSMNLSSITIPSSVTSIGEMAFMNCSGLTTLTCLSNTPPTLGIVCFSRTALTDVFVPSDAAVTAYKASSWGTDFTGDIIKKVLTITSSSAGNWSASGTWSGGVVPTIGQSAVIAHDIVLDANASVSELTINSGKVLNVNAGMQLTVGSTLTNDGALNLLSTVADGTATILTPAALSGTGTYSVLQYLASGRNWYVSSPVESAQSTIFTTASNVWGYNEVTGSWNDPVTALSPLKGYVAAVTSNGTVTFAGGKFNTGPIADATLTATAGTYQGFHLVGNPYPSYTNWVMATKTNLEQSIWYRTANASGSPVFDTFGATSLIGTHNNNNNLIDVTRYIAPMQAVWVRVNAGTTGTVGFDNNMRSHNDQTVPTNRLKAPTNRVKIPAVTTQQVLRLQVSNGINSDEAIILFNTNAADGYDGYDSPKMSNNMVAIPEIYTLAGSERMVINGLNSVSANPALTLGFTTGASNTFSIKATEISNFEEGTKIILKDNLLDTEKELTIGTDYRFSSPITSTATRFTLLLKTTANVTALNNIEGETLTVFQQDGHITINRNNAQPGSITVYNMMGKKLVDVSTTSTNTELNMSFVPGVYLVALTAGGNKNTKKILIK